MHGASLRSVSWSGLKFDSGQSSFRLAALPRLGFLFKLIDFFEGKRDCLILFGAIFVSVLFSLLELLLSLFELVVQLNGSFFGSFRLGTHQHPLLIERKIV